MAPREGTEKQSVAGKLHQTGTEIGWALIEISPSCEKGS
jgi:hypothetical protein